MIALLPILSFRPRRFSSARNNNPALYKADEIEMDAYQREKDYHERQISYWEAQITDKQPIMLELTIRVEMVKRLKE